jgi:hypothetical protein
MRALFLFICEGLAELLIVNGERINLQHLLLYDGFALLE